MNLLITGAWQQAEQYIEKIKQQGHCVIYQKDENEQLSCSFQWVEGVICNGLFLFHPIEKFTDLKFIQLTSAGTDRVPMEYIQKKGIELYSAHGVYSIPMAEYTVGGILALYRQADVFQKQQKLHQWKRQRTLCELFGKTVCIIGCGSVGNECARRFHAFGCRVLGIGSFQRKHELYESIAGSGELESILPEADIVVLAVPYTKETENLMNDHTFSLMKKGAMIVNIARGAVVSEPALIRALQEKLGGAVLDVFQEEPLDEKSPLWDMEHVILTPHNSFVGDGNGERLAEVIKKNLNTVLEKDMK